MTWLLESNRTAASDFLPLSMSPRWMYLQRMRPRLCFSEVYNAGRPRIRPAAARQDTPARERLCCKFRILARNSYQERDSQSVFGGIVRALYYRRRQLPPEGATSLGFSTVFQFPSWAGMFRQPAAGSPSGIDW